MKFFVTESKFKLPPHSGQILANTITIKELYKSVLYMCAHVLSLLDVLIKATVILWNALLIANKILSRHMDFYPHPIKMVSSPIESHMSRYFNCLNPDYIDLS